MSVHQCRNDQLMFHQQAIVWLQQFILTERAPWIRWSVSLGLFLVAFLVRYYLASSLPAGFPYLTFFPAVILATFVGGLWPGIINAILGCIASWYFFISPANSFELNGGAAIALAFYAFIVSVDVLIIHSIKVTARHLQAERGAFQALTETLTLANAQLEKNRADQMFLSRELGHRMKNQLAIVQAIVNQTLRSAPDLISAGKSLSDRVAVLSRAHDILISGATSGTAVGEIVRNAVFLHDDKFKSRFKVEGPETPIASRPALSLSLILHELSTNAAKYGALSRPEGKVTIYWEVTQTSAERTFLLTWEESGGPAIAEPVRKGFGSRLIRAGLAGTTMNRVSIHYNESGVKCELVADLLSLQSEL